MKLGKALLLVFLIGAGFYLVRAYQPSINVIYPQECAFLIDEQFSQTFQQKLQTHAIKIYKQTRDPQQVIDNIAQTFPEVSEMDAYICKTDKVCFTFDGAKPLFKINDALVVCHNHQVVLKDCYNKDVLHDLYGIAAKEKQAVQSLTTFFSMVPTRVFDEFDIIWTSDDEVKLQTKDKKQESLLFSAYVAPTQKDIDLFKQIQQAEQKKGKKKKRIYDFRFKNQVVIR